MKGEMDRHTSIVASLVLIALAGGPEALAGEKHRIQPYAKNPY